MITVSGCRARSSAEDGWPELQRASGPARSPQVVPKMRLIDQHGHVAADPVALAGDAGERAGRRDTHGGGDAFSSTTSGHGGKYGSRPWASTCPAAAIQPAGSARCRPRRRGRTAPGGWSPTGDPARHGGHVFRISARHAPRGRPRHGQPVGAAEARIDDVRRTQYGDPITLARRTSGSGAGERSLQLGIGVRQAPARPGLRVHTPISRHRVHPAGTAAPQSAAATSARVAAARTPGQLVQPHGGVDLVDHG